MILMQGQGVSKGVVKGHVYFYQRAPAAPCRAAGSPEEEKRRLEEAKAKSMEQLNALADRAREEAGDESAILFETHALFVEDEDYVECIMNELEAEQCNIEHAVQTAGIHFAEMFANMDDAYMQARAADVRDVTQRILNNLMGIVPGGIDSEEPVILAADDLAPSETIQLDKSKILAFATRAAAITCSRSGAIPAMPTLAEVEGK